MDTLLLPSEQDFKRWIREALKEYLEESTTASTTSFEKEELLLNRVEVAKLLRVSLVTLTDWMKRGLPCHKQRGRVYFMRSEVLEYIKTTRPNQFKFSKRFSETKL